ncbi:unnamed protein product [Boreogadus saida]
MASGNGNPDSSESLKRDILERLHHRLVHILERQPLDIEGLQFACRQEYNFVIFGGIDGYSRKIMYLKVANNNRSDTHLDFFNEAVNKHGFPLRVRGDHGGENVGVAELMFSVRGTDSNSFIAGKSVHNQRIERLWRDVFMSVTEIEWEESGFTNEPHSGVNVPTLDIPLLDPEIMQLQENIDPLQESECFGVDIYLNTVRYVENLLEAR